MSNGGTVVEFTAGMKVGPDERYEIVRICGRGGMGVVYEAVDHGLDRPRKVALKQLNKVFAGDPRHIDNVRREVALARDLGHPNIVRVYEYIKWRDEHLVIMEWMAGGTLVEELYNQEEKRFTPDNALKLLKPIAAALDYAHKRKPPVVHRDLKPLNVMLTEDGDVKVTDFGLSREVKESVTRVTGKDSSGSLEYMPFEQYMGDSPAPVHDIYALGITAYELLNGQPPFTRGDLGLQHKDKTPATIADIPQELMDVLLKCLAKDEKERYASTGEFIVEFEGAVNGDLSVVTEQEGAAEIAVSEEIHVEEEKVSKKTEKEKEKAEKKAEAAHKNITAKLTEVEDMLSEARKALSGENFQVVDELTSKILELDADNQEAKSLSKEAIGNARKILSRDTFIGIAVVIGLIIAAFLFMGDQEADAKQQELEQLTSKMKFVKGGTFQCKDIDGNIYETIQIGEQIWMAENLKVTHYKNGDKIQYVQQESAEPDVWGKLSTGAYGYYNDDPTNQETYGNLYNWYTVDDSRGVCPEGWHVPTDEEFMELEMELGMSEEDANSTGSRGTNEASKLAGSSDLWNDGNLVNNSEFGTSGFKGLPAGYRTNYNGYYTYMGNYGYFWSSSELSSNYAWARCLGYNYSSVSRYYYYRQSGFSIRCLGD